MRILFVSPDIEEPRRGIGVILNSMIIAANEAGHEVGVLSGQPKARNIRDSRAVSSRIEHLHMQRYLEDGRASFEHIVPGGLRIRNILKATLKLEVFRPRAFTIDRSLLNNPDAELSKFSFVVQASYVYQFMTRNFSLMTRLAVRRAVKKSKADIVILASPSMLRKRDVKPARLVHFMHDVMPIELAETPPDNDTPLRYARQLTSSIRNSDLMLANSKDTKKKILEISPKSSVEVVYGAPSSNPQEVKTDASILEKFKLGNDGYLLFISSIEKRKNISLLLDAYVDAFDRLAMPLVLVGGQGYGFEDIAKKYWSLPTHIRKEVVFTGYVSETEKFSLLKNARAFVFPSVYEGFGLMVAESIMSNTPVLASRKGGLAEVGGEAAHYIENPYDLKEISEKMIEISTNQKLRNTLRKNAKTVSETFTQDKFNKRFKKALESLK